MNDKQLFATVGVIIIVAALVATLLASPTGFNFSSSRTTIEVGDQVQVEYTGSLQNGTVFDTSRQTVAKEAGIYNPERPYTPLSFTVGAQQMIQGFDTAVQGMKKGEKKTITLTPDQAYGEYDETRIIAANRVEVINRTIELNKTLQITAEQFQTVFNEAPTLNKTYQTSQSPWAFKVIALDQDNVTLELQVTLGQKVTLPQTSWESEIVSVNPVVKVRQNPQNGQVIQTSLGNATIQLTPQEIKVTANPPLGMQINTFFGAAQVKRVNETAVFLDVNHPLAGKTLVFDIEVVGINKTKSG